jgi:hypothetical protein
VITLNDEFRGDAGVARLLDRQQVLVDVSGAVMIPIVELLDRAKHAIDSGEMSLHAAAEDIAAAQEQGATQREIAEAVGKSAAWVNRLLQWRQSGYRDGTAFGPQAKASRQRARRVQASERPATTSEQAQTAAARARAETAKAEAAKAKADAQKARADAARAKADATKARADTKRAEHDAFGRMFGGSFGSSTRKIPNGPRELLVKALGMLGSAHDGERANAARVVEQKRRELGLIWDELIIPADEARARAA